MAQHATSREIHTESPNSGLLATPGEMLEQDLQLATGFLEQSRSMTLGNVSMSVLKFNHGQCAYLFKKLEMAVQSAKHCISLSPREQISEYLTNGKILVRLAMDVTSFIQECCKAEWIQPASLSMNAFEHVASLAYHLELCIWSFRNRNEIILGTALRGALISISEAEDGSLISGSQALDQDNLLKEVEAALNLNRISNPQERQLANSLLERLKAPVAGSPIPEKLDLSQLSFMRVDFHSLERKESLGMGSIGDVYKVKWLGAYAAEKTFPLHAGDLSDFAPEVSILARLSHPNIVRLLCYVKEEGKCSIVLELMDKDLTKLIEERLELDATRKFPFSIDEAVDIMLQIAQGMHYLHRKRVLHRDLKPSNILMKCVKLEEVDVEFVHAKVADFGISKTKEKSITLSHPTWNTGTNRWMAPEVIHFPQGGSCDTQTITSERYPYKSDVYSFAMVCYEILTGDVPCSADVPNEAKRMVLRGDRPPLPPHCPSCLGSMIKKCWRSEPMERPSFADICTELRFMKGSLLIGRDL